VREAAVLVRTILHPAIYRHSIRTFLLGRQAAQCDGAADVDDESLCIAALFHDAGTAERYNGTVRFEVEGADAAAAFLAERGWKSATIDHIWEAIALHTTPDIPERRGPIAHYLRRGVQIEFGPPELRSRFTDSIADAEADYPRANIEEILQTLVIEQAVERPSKAAAPSWAADLLRHHEPGRAGINPAF
jgi:hypothetical protein